MERSLYTGVRKATIDDYEAILDILKDSSIEAEYLADYFHLLISQSNFTGYIVYFEGNIAGFGGISVVDDGCTAVSRGGRIKKQYRGKGLFDALRLIDLYHPDVTSLAPTIGTNDLEVFKKFRGDADFRLAIERKMVFYQTSLFKLRDRLISTSYEIGNIKRLNNEDLSEMFLNKSKYQQVLKENRLFIDFVPYKMVSSNSKFILMKRTVAFVSYLDEPEQTLLTFCTYKYVRSPNNELICNFDIYGAINECLSMHVLAHINCFKEKIEDTLTIKMIYKNFSDDINTAMLSVGFEKAPKEKYKICIEMDVKSKSKL